MLNKNKTPKKKFKAFDLSEINELKLIIFFVEEYLELPVKLKIGELGGRIVSIKKGRGIPENENTLISEEHNGYVIIATARSEDAKNIVLAVATEFNFHLPHTGRGFIVDVDGYMGAKGILAE